MLAPWKESYDKLDSVLKSRDITLLTNVHVVKGKILLVVMYRCESWTKNKAEHQRINACKLWCYRRLLGVPWTARRTNQSILKENNPWIFIGRTDAEAEAPILWPCDAKNTLIGKDPDAGKGCRRRRGWQRMRWLDGITKSMDMSVWENSRR